MNKKRKLVIAVIVSATAGVFALQNVFAPSPVEIPIHTFSVTLTPTATITTSPTYAGCGYMWAYHDDADLSVKLNEVVIALDPSSSANAQLFGEDCIYADGHSTFTTMETDFYVRLSVKDLSTKEAFGNWIKQIMDFIIGLPEDDVQGQKGFVEFSFIESDQDRIVVRVGTNDYLNSASEADGLEVFQKFFTPTPPPVTQAPITPTATP